MRTKEPPGGLARLGDLGRFAFFACLGSVLVACKSAPPPAPPPIVAPAAPPPVTPAVTAALSDGVGFRPGVGEELRTRNARFKVAAPNEILGWADDDIGASTAAFQQSCRVLQRKPSWSSLCSGREAQLGDPAAMRGFFEREFVFLRVFTLKAEPEGMVTGYAEPLLAGSRERTGAFIHPVYGTPNDLLTFDWSVVPVAQRQSVVSVRPQGRELRLATAGEPGALQLDLRGMDLDSRERRLRLRQDGQRLVPYHTREQIQALGTRLNAPVLAWVQDPMALYAMQIQGSGRISLPGGEVVRVGFAEQNGHPFKPLRVRPKAGEKRVVTRGGAAVEEPINFELAESDDDGPGDSDATPAEAGGANASGAEATDEPVTRGGSSRRPRAAAGAAATGGSVDAVVDQLLASRTAAKPAARRTPAAATPARPKPAAAQLGSDPSFVFFRVANDQSAKAGPIGALGVPLTAGRSIAVDPRVTPLGYPIFLTALPERGSGSQPMRKLVFAQDTGGAIRGALRADHFWGFGSEAMQAAYRTRLRGQFWLMMPRAEYRELRAGTIRTRGAPLRPGEAAELDRDCLMPDGEHCTEVDAEAAASRPE